MLFNKTLTILLACFIGLVSCVPDTEENEHDENEHVSPCIERRVDKNLLILKPAEGIVYYEEVPFTGESMEIAKDKVVGSIQYKNGKKHGVEQKWYQDRTLSYRANYVNGKLHGAVESWWKNGTNRSFSQFENGQAHGIQTQWYKSGVLFKEQNLVYGREEGIQKAWRENGKIYNNYEAVNGRIFGLKRATLCYELDDEIVTFND